MCSKPYSTKMLEGIFLSTSMSNRIISFSFWYILLKTKKMRNIFRTPSIQYQYFVLTQNELCIWISVVHVGNMPRFIQCARTNYVRMETSFKGTNYKRSILRRTKNYEFEISCMNQELCFKKSTNHMSFYIYMGFESCKKIKNFY